MSNGDSFKSEMLEPNSPESNGVISIFMPTAITVRQLSNSKRQRSKYKVSNKYILLNTTVFFPKILPPFIISLKSVTTPNYSSNLKHFSNSDNTKDYTNDLDKTDQNPDSPPLLLAAGHMNKFFLYPNKYGQPCYILKVTSAREGQFYYLLHKLAGQLLKMYPTLIPLLGKEKAKSISNETELYDSLDTLKHSKTKRRKSIRSPYESNNYSIHTNYNLNISNDELVSISLKDQLFAQAFLKYTPKCFKAYSHQLPFIDEHSRNANQNKEINVIKLINLNYKLKLPLILDIKMGRRLYGDDASQVKIEKLSKKAIGRSISSLGFSFSGMIGYNFKENHLKIYGGSRSDDTSESNPQTVDDYADHVFYKFLCAFRSPTISISVGQFLFKQLKSILDIMNEQTLIAFYGSSLLFVGDTSLTEDVEPMGYVKVRMIDFANVTLFSSKKDEDYIFGLKNLLTALKMAIDKF